MKIKEIIFESQTLTVRRLDEGARIAHAEDLVFFEGSGGALRAVANIMGLEKNRDTLSIKWDGRPAVVFGRTPDGVFILTDKAGWGAKGYNGLYRSAKEFVAQKQSKGGDEAYLAKIVSIWPIIEKATPPAYRGFVLGDIMWFPGEIADNGKRYVFTPNTVTYEVDKNSDLGSQIGHSKAGIAVHTFFPDVGQEGTALKNTAGLNLGGELCVLGPEIKNEATLQQDKAKSKQLTSFIKTNAKLIDALLDQKTLSELKMSGFPDVLYTYVNASTKTQDLSMLHERFLPWVQTNNKLSKIMVEKVTNYARENSAAMKAIFDIFDGISYLKLDVIRQLDSHEGAVIAHVKGTRGGEGYVNTDKGGAIKYVNRLGFSAANFAGNA
jgi:hypothetical protein